eukprot:3434884-Alexandrium_andersonii.AAC.1
MASTNCPPPQLRWEAPPPEGLRDLPQRRGGCRSGRAQPPGWCQDAKHDLRGCSEAAPADCPPHGRADPGQLPHRG